MLLKVISSVAAGALGFSTVLGAAPAFAQSPTPPTPGDLGDEDFLSQWINPALRPGEADSDLQLDLLRASVQGSTLKASLTVRNTSQEESLELMMVARRAQAISDASQGQWVLGASAANYGYYGKITEIDALAPGETRTVEVEVPLAPEEPGALSINSPGVYPVMFTLEDLQTTHTTERFLLSIPQLPKPEEEEEPAQLSVVYPIAAPIDIVPGETGSAPEDAPLILSSETLSTQMSAGGRLDSLVDNYMEAEHQDALCLAIDPALVNVAQRMSQGYTVSPARDINEHPQRLRDSWTDNDEDVPSAPGEGAEEAQEWLDKLRSAVDEGCVTALPWAGTDINAVVTTGDTWLVREALERGTWTLNRILETTSVPNTVIPPSGYITADSIAPLEWADHSRSHLGDAGMSGQWEQAQNKQSSPAAAAQAVHALVADSTITGQEQFHHLNPNVIASTFDADLAAALAQTGTAPSTVAFSPTENRFDYRVDSPAARTLSATGSLRAEVHSAEDPVLAMLPLNLDPASAHGVIDTVDELINSHQASPLGLGEFLHSAPAQDPAEVVEVTDPSRLSTAEITTASGQANFIDDLTRLMVNDPAIALTRYGFSYPLRQELLMALASPGRSSLATYEQAVSYTQQALGSQQDMLDHLGSGVRLLPPGNVYTRTSASSPLLIVAENNLPLPVQAQVDYNAPEGTSLSVPSPIRIPARGSITVEMTADLPLTGQHNIRLWLATVDGAAVSTPVDISVQTRAGTKALLIMLAVLALVIASFFIRRRARGPDRKKS